MLSKIDRFKMEEKLLPKMPRKIKKRVEEKKAKSRSKSKDSKKNKRRGSSVLSSASDKTDMSQYEEIDDPADKKQMIKIKVPIEDLTQKQIGILKMAENIAQIDFKIEF